jgi:branched-chain amino acid transport system ATP-binding protein
MLEVEDLVVSYGGSTALWGVSLAAASGETVAMVGPNGAGKTSLMHALGGLVPIAGGRVRLAGEDITRLPAHARAVRGLALCPEGRRLFGSLNVYENLLAGAHTCRDRRRLGVRLERVHTLFPRLAERRQQAARTLSGGEQQMLAIGRALMAEPRLLLLDEPSLGLAPIVAREVFGAIGQVRADGVTVLLVEQNVQDSLAVANRGYVLENGRIRLTAPAADLLASDDLRTSYLGLGEAPASS